MGFGDASFIQTVEAPEVSALSRQLLGALDFRGYAGLEFKLDARDNTYKFIELNPRSEGFVQVAVSAGLDLPWIGYAYLAEHTPPAPAAFRVGSTPWPTLRSPSRCRTRPRRTPGTRRRTGNRPCVATQPG